MMTVVVSMGGEFCRASVFLTNELIEVALRGGGSWEVDTRSPYCVEAPSAESFRIGGG